jgi:gamma-glutamyltranspeptidase/glutathione hydrolase
VRFPFRPLPALLASLVAAALASCRQQPRSEPARSGQPTAIIEQREPVRSIDPSSELATFPSEWSMARASAPSFAPSAMIATNSAPGTLAGLEILKRGGNAVDAAVAVAFAMAVSYPEAGNIGGGGFLVIRMADGRTGALDFRERAPGLASHDMYLDAAGKLTMDALIGHRASGVPGSVAGLLAGLEKYGTLSRRDVMAPAIRLAREGVAVDSSLHNSLLRARGQITRFGGGPTFYPGGVVPAIGSKLAQPDLARTLEAIAERGADGFYRGPVADSIVAEMGRGGGLISHKDLSSYRASWRRPIIGTYRGYTLVTMPPSSSGGVTVLETLNILESFPTPAPFGSTTQMHRLVGAFQRAYLDRNENLGDPDFVRMPIDRLTDKAYARRLRASMSDTRATPTATLRAKPGPSEGLNTTNISVADAMGNLAAMTTTLNGLYGSGVWVRGAGFFLNNEMDDFATKPGAPNMFGLVQGEANAIAPGKRMLSAMAPTIVADPAGEALMIVGGRGGSRIISAVVQAIVNVIDHRMALGQAIGAPRMHYQSLPDTVDFEKGGLSAAVLDSLRAMGHVLQPGGTGNLTAILRVKGGWQGAYDPRKHGLAAGY